MEDRINYQIFTLISTFSYILFCRSRKIVLVGDLISNEKLYLD